MKMKDAGYWSLPGNNDQFIYRIIPGGNGSVEVFDNAGHVGTFKTLREAIQALMGVKGRP